MNNADYDVRQREIDAFEAQRAAYNDAFSRMMAEGGEVKSLTDEVAAAGRGGDELLAYLSPESVELLKEQGGSGTINPETGLPEFMAFRQTVEYLRELQVAEAAAAAKAAEDARLASAKAAADAQELANFRAAADAKAIADAKADTDARVAANTKAASDRAAADVTAKATLAAIPINKVAVPTMALNAPTARSTSAMPSSIPYTPPATPSMRSVTGMQSRQPTDGIPVSMPSVPDYSSRGIGAVGPIDLTGTMGATPFMSPMMFSRQPKTNTLYGFAKGGGVDVSALLAQNTETLSDEVPDEVINTNPVGTAQKMLADLGNLGKVSPTRQSIKRVRTAPGGGATADKSMQMPFEGLGRGDLGAMKDVTPTARNPDSARAQMEELARVYQLKIKAAQNKGRGLSANTFGAPTLEGPTLTKNKLTKKRFKDGGEAKKPDGEEAEPLRSPEEQPVSEESSASRALGSFVSRLKEGTQGYLGLDPGISGSDAYRTGQALGNMPGVGAPAAAAGIFIGKGAKGWNAASNALAKKVAKQGASPEEVWKTTGNFKAPDGQWRQEISDAGAQVRESFFQGPADRVLMHPELFANYPELGKIMTSKDPYRTSSVLMGGTGPDSIIRLGTAGGKNENAKGMLHEMQHAIQFKEGFGQGGSKDMAFTDPRAFEILKEVRARMAQPTSIEDFAKVAWQSNEVTPEIAKKYQQYLDYHKKSLKAMDTEAQKGAANLYYNRLLGEAEARAVEGRKSFTMDQRLQLIPSQSYRMNAGRDIIPLDQLIVKRAGGSPEEGELSQEEIDAASRPAFVTPSSGKGRKEGEISRQLQSGDAYINMAKGMTEMPYNLAGAPMDIAMLVRQGLTGQAPAGQVGTSDYIKSKMTEFGIRQAPPTDPTSKGFYTAGELLSNLVNPAGVTRAGVKAAQKTGEAATAVAKDFQQYNRQLSVPGASYVSRAPGGYFPTSRGMGEKTAEEINNTKLSDLPENFVSWLNGQVQFGRALTDDRNKSSFLGLGPKKESLGDKYNRWKAETGNKDYTFGILSGVDKSFQPVLKKITELEPGEKRDALFQMFNQKAKDFYSKQAGSVQDPLRADILSGNIKFDIDSKMGDVFPQVLVKQAAQGNIQALRLLEKNYDDMLGIKAVVPYRRVPSRPDDGAPPNTLKRQIIESVRDNLDSIPDSQLLAYASKKPLPGPDGVAKAAKEVRLKLKENPNLFSTVLEPNIERTVFARESRYSDVDMAKHPSLYGTTATKAMINPKGPVLTKEQLDAMETVPPGYFLPELETAINKNQPILDAQEYGNLKLLGLNPDNLLQEASKLSTKDLNSMGFTDFLKKAYTSTQEMAQLEKDLKRVKPLLQQGKPPPANVMLFGVKDFLPTVNDMRWVKVTNPDGVKSIAAGMNNSIGSYATSETYGALGRGRRALDSGEVEVYALYDKNHVPHVTVEYGTGKSSVPENQRSQVLQLTGNGPLTANESSNNYAEQIAALVNALPIKNVTALPASTQKILKNNFFEFKDNRVVRNEEEFTKNQALKKELGLAKGGLVDKNIAFIKAHA